MCLIFSVGYLDLRVKGGDSKGLCVDASFTLIQVSAIDQPAPASIKEKERMC